MMRVLGWISAVATLATPWLRAQVPPAQFRFLAAGCEARIFHAMQGELWVDMRMKRLARLDGRLEENVDFGYGLLGRLHKGCWFCLERTPVSATDWKTARLEIHMSDAGRFCSNRSPGRPAKRAMALRLYRRG